MPSILNISKLQLELIIAEACKKVIVKDIDFNNSDQYINYYFHKIKKLQKIHDSGEPASTKDLQKLIKENLKIFKKLPLVKYGWCIFDVKRLLHHYIKEKL